MKDLYLSQQAATGKNRAQGVRKDVFRPFRDNKIRVLTGFYYLQPRFGRGARNR